MSVLEISFNKQFNLFKEKNIAEKKNDFSSKNFPITKRLDNFSLSRYNDDIWHFTYYRSINTQSPKLKFNCFDDFDSRQEATKILFLYMLNSGSRGSVSALLYASVYNFYKNIFLPISEHINRKNLRLSAFLVNESEMML